MAEVPNMVVRIDGAGADALRAVAREVAAMVRLAERGWLHQPAAVAMLRDLASSVDAALAGLHLADRRREQDELRLARIELATTQKALEKAQQRLRLVESLNGLLCEARDDWAKLAIERGRELTAIKEGDGQCPREFPVDGERHRCLLPAGHEGRHRYRIAPRTQR